MKPRLSDDIKGSDQLERLHNVSIGCGKPLSATEVVTLKNEAQANLRKEHDTGNIEREEKTPGATQREELPSSRIMRFAHQYKTLHSKGEYMGKMVTFGNRYGRNEKCPCKSGKKFKHCCIKNHDHNMWRLSRLQWAMETFKSKIEKLGLKIGVHI